MAKAYLAVVRGAPAGDFTSSAPIGHSATSVVTMRRSAAADAKNPRAARTDFEVQRRGPERCLLRCVPHALHDPIPFDPDSPEPFLDEGRHEYRFWLTEVGGKPNPAQLEQIAMNFVTPVELMVDSAHPGASKR